MSRRRLPRATRILPRLVDPARDGRQTPVVLCIDVEPDDRIFEASDARPWRGFERLLERLPALRERLSEITGAPASFAWFLRMDPQVAQTWGSADWVVDTYGAAFEDLLSRGDDIGLHTHTWRAAGEHGGWYADFEDDAWATYCVEVALDAFERAFQRPCRLHRGGDHHLTGAMLSRLEERGVLVDLTVEPGRRGPGVIEGEAFRGRCVEYRGVPTVPYRSSPATFPREDPGRSTGPLLMPLTTGPGRRLARVPILLHSDPRRFIPRIEFELLRRKDPMLVFAVRSELALGSRWEAFVRNLEHLGSHRGVQFLTPTATLALQEPGHVLEPAAHAG